ncbi:HAD family hydrolase [Lachnospiraceae bacterium 29-84]
MPKKINAILFDLDGTLLDTLTDLTNSVNHAMERFGFPKHTEDGVRRMVGNGVSVLMERAIPNGRENPGFDECLKVFREHYELHKKDFTKPFPGVMGFLEKASSQGYQLGVVSNKFDLAVKGLCQDYFAPYITAAIGESAQIARKPAPDTVFAAMEELHVTPSQCVYVGDSDVDIATAKNSGIPCISVSWGFRSRKFLQAHGARYIAGSMAELEEILASFQQDSPQV